MTERLMEEERVPLAVLAAELGVDRKTVSRWADEGYKGQRLESFRIGKKRHSTWPAAKRFLAAVNQKSVLVGTAQAVSGALRATGVDPHDESTA